MKRIFLPLVLVASLVAKAQTPTPDKLWGRLFTDVQLTRALGDNKTFVDMVPQYQPAHVLKKYAALKKRDSGTLRNFVLANFYLPESTPVPISSAPDLTTHLTTLWSALTRKADTLRQWSSLLPLPNSYIVPGGRFREIYYWDSYFTMQGLSVSNRYDLIENMLDNFKYLIDAYGHIPNGNRNYYVSRSQPPYFALMVELLQQKSGAAIYKKYLPAMEKEYTWWMNGDNRYLESSAYRRVVKLPDGTILNRYFDDNNIPRQESYWEDVRTAKTSAGGDKAAYRNLRAAAESGWDFSSRWFADTLHLSTIETINIIPVDLNCLLYQYEYVLSAAATALGQETKASQYKAKAERRKAAIVKYCWDEEAGFFFDYDFVKKHRTKKWSLAGAMPLFCNLATASQAEAVKDHIEQKFLRDGGVVTTPYKTGQQWDAPNGWAPLQFIVVKGLQNYNHFAIAKTVAERWMHVNESVFKATGKMMEKYNVEDLTLKSGGGEYPAQDGFGWTNGVYLKFQQMLQLNEFFEKPETLPSPVRN